MVFIQAILYPDCMYGLRDSFVRKIFKDHSGNAGC